MLMFTILQIGYIIKTNFAAWAVLETLDNETSQTLWHDKNLLDTLLYDFTSL